MTTELSGYTMMLRLQKARKKHAISATAQAVFHELTMVCNDAGEGSVWPTVFTVRNQDLCGALCITENTLYRARVELIEAGLLSYRSGKSRMAPSDYSFNPKKFTLSTTSKSAVVNSTTSTTTAETTAKFEAVVEVVGDLTTSKFEDNTINNTVVPKEETRNLNSSASHDAGRQKNYSSTPTEERKKSGAQKKKEATPHWQPIVDVWFQFNRDQYNGFEVQLEPKDAANLKSIAEKLQQRSEGKGMAWDEPTAASTFLNFLKHAHGSSQWLRDHFSLSNLLSQLQDLLKNAAAGKTNTGGSSGSNGRGNVISVGRAFSKIDGLYGCAGFGR